MYITTGEVNLLERIHPAYRLLPENLSHATIRAEVSQLQAIGHERGAAMIAALVDACYRGLLDIEGLLETGFDTNAMDCTMDGVKDTIAELKAITGAKFEIG